MEDEREEGAREFDDEYDFDISRIRDKLGEQTETVTNEKESIFATAAVKEASTGVTVQLDGTRPTVTVSEPVTETTVRSKTKNMTIDPNTSLVKAFEDIVRSAKYYHELIEDFWGT